MLELWQSGAGDLGAKKAGDTYGAEHLCRLLGKSTYLPLSLPPLSPRAKLTRHTVSLPELIAQTNMDQQSVGRLREELVKIANWLGRKDNTLKYFVGEYETPNQSYIDKARGF